MNSNEQSPISNQSIYELITALSEGEKAQYDTIIRSTNLPSSAFENFSSWSSDCYTRNCIAENEKFELILLCWEKGQVTPIHDHGGEECWVQVIKGDFKETIYKVDEAGDLFTVQSTISKVGDVTYMIDFMGFHRLENLSDQRSMTLHLYAKPIRNCNALDEKSGKFVRKNMVYNTFPEFGTHLK